ncbi:MAG TPA: transglycosylase domain-containing protein [Ornithinibacter sp.]|nr:transglycosylase domain-containing protein [Ornithinibacter sp.]
MPRYLKTAIAVALVVLTPVTSAGVMLGAFLFLPLPAQLPERVPPSPSQISRVYDAAGNEIGTFKQFETSIPVAPEDIPEHLKQAVVAAEDRSFYSHGGVDVRGTMRALLADLRGGEVRQGGSTITQQLVKNTVTGGERSITRKIREAVLASQLDRQVDKEEILFEYLSVIYLGEGAYGVGAAAETYFRKPVQDLTLSESATLAGLIPAPSRYSPRVDLRAAEVKRMTVLRAMRGEDMITDEEYLAAAYQPLKLVREGGGTPGFVTLVHPPQEQVSADPYFTDYVARWLEDHLPGGLDQIYRGGLRIETTLDPRLQESAKRHVAEFLEGTEPDLRTSLVSIEPPTGYVRAFVSGRDYATDQVNYALGADGGGSGRQPGSAFKPFVLARAFQAGLTPNTTYSGASHDVTEPCGPRADGSPTVIGNSSGRYGSLSLRNATVASVNTVFTRLILDVGVKETMDLARSMGLTSVRAYDGARDCASVALGAESVSPLDMASSYGVFAARGQRAEPTPVLRVIGRDGTVLIDNSKPKVARVLDEKVADNVTDVMRGVLVDGTARGKGIDRPAAGKTGTTQDNKDAWFVGFTPTLSTSVWMGYENKTESKTLAGVHGRQEVYGGTFSATIWQAFMRDALRDVPVTDFSEPAPIEAVPDAVQVRARRGFAPGPRMYPRQAPGGGTYAEDLPTPQAEPPTTTTAPTTTTTTTTLLPDETTTTTEGETATG